MGLKDISRNLHQYKKLVKIGITEQGHDTKQLFQRARFVVK